MTIINEFPDLGDFLFHVIISYVLVFLPRALTCITQCAKRALSIAIGTATKPLPRVLTTTMAAKASSVLMRNMQILKQSLPQYLSRTDAHISHVNRLLAQTSTLDTTLLTLTYTLHLLHSQLSRLTARRLVLLTAEKITANASVSETAILVPADPTQKILTAILPTSAPHSRLLRFTTSIKALAALIDDVRLFLRLWGLCGIWAWAVRTWKQPPRDGVLRAIAWAQVAANTAYQVLENGAYLAEHGVLSAEGGRVGRWYAWSSRFWMMHVGLDLGRLVRVRALRREREQRERVSRQGEGVLEEKEEKMAREARAAEEKQWWRELVVNLAYAPMTVHWSLEEGLLSEAQVGALGVIVGAMGIGEAWRGCN